ncbi:DUF4232 domain-containing protein [Streptomyces sp. IBSNAI002]|uniref:DUF4232 domain-containing protein n=1 Tax=Streptomyces sp. IBSNAI002 TaxID=3457500 RepID=UPI003FD360F8
MADDLSFALRELADSAGTPAPTTGAEVRRRAASRRRRRHAALAGGTAVLAAALVFGLAAAFGGPEPDRRPTLPADSPTAPSPTASAPAGPSAVATSPTSPTSQSSPASPSAPGVVVGCAPGDLTFSATSEDPQGKSVRHLLLTVTNTGNKKCNLYQYPHLKFDGARSAIAVIKDSQDAPVTLAPGGKAYAALLATGGRMDTYETNTIPLRLQGPDPDSNTSAPITLDLPGQVPFDDGARVTHWTTASGLALRFIMSS